MAKKEKKNIQHVKPEGNVTGRREIEREADGKFKPGESPNINGPGRLRQAHVDIVERSYIVGAAEGARLGGICIRTLYGWRKKYKKGLIQENVRTNLFTVDGQMVGKERKERRWQVTEEVKALLEENVAASELAYFKAPIEMAMQIEAYFEECDELKKPYTIPGMAHYLGFSNKRTMANYMVKEGFYIVISRALLRIETQRNEQLIADKGPKSGHIFDLKNNFGWIDETRTRTRKEDVTPDEITINQQTNNSIENVQLNALPAAPQSIEEWQSWYNGFMKASQEREIAVVEAETLPTQGEVER